MRTIAPSAVRPLAFGLGFPVFSLMTSLIFSSVAQGAPNSESAPPPPVLVDQMEVSQEKEANIDSPKRNPSTQAEEVRPKAPLNAPEVATEMRLFASLLGASLGGGLVAGAGLALGAVVMVGALALGAAAAPASAGVIATLIVVSVALFALVPGLGAVGAGLGSLLATGRHTPEKGGQLLAVVGQIYLALAVVIGLVAMIAGVGLLVAGGGGGPLGNLGGCGNGCGHLGGPKTTLRADPSGKEASLEKPMDPLMLHPAWGATGGVFLGAAMGITLAAVLALATPIGGSFASPLLVTGIVGAGAVAGSLLGVLVGGALGAASGNWQLSAEEEPLSDAQEENVGNEGEASFDETRALRR